MPRGKASSARKRQTFKAYEPTFHPRGTTYVFHRPPDHVLDERDNALRAPRTLTQVLLGDPLPGRSALDHK